MKIQILDNSGFDDQFIREVRVSYLICDQETVVIDSPEEAAFFVRSVLLDNSREHFVALYLDGANKVASYSIVSIGTANSAAISPREVFQRAVIVGAVSLIVAHNHPSGSTKPSDADKTATKRLAEAGDLLGIPLLDHLIITDRSFLSIKEHMPW